jgi:hypothetical protein
MRQNFSDFLKKAKQVGKFQLKSKRITSNYFKFINQQVILAETKR